MKKRDNIHLIRAKHSLDDEFYTSYEHAKQMITPFAKHFSRKNILCNCDNPDTSEVFDFMRDSFDAFKLSKLVGVGYGSRMQVITKDGIEDIEVKNNGDFRTGESLEALKACDVVVSNPPFSQNMFIDFIKLVMVNKKDLLAIGPLTGVKAKDVKPYIIAGKLNAIKSPYEDFKRPNDKKDEKAQVAIYTTYKEDPFGKELELDEDVDIASLPIDSKYMVPVSIASNGAFSIKEIPADSNGVIDKIIVPISVFRKNWRKHFKILDIINTVEVSRRKLMPGVLMQYI